MTTWYLKSVLCAALLLAIYHLFLEKEKMHRFNRFYLLVSLVISFIIPFISIELKQPSLPVKETIILLTDNFTTLSQQTTAVVNNSSLLSSIALYIYIAVTSILLSRFIRNSISLLYKIKNNKTVSYKKAQLVLTSDLLVPHSFLHYIFLDKKQFEEGVIEKEILQHELTHVQQKHSLDNICIELMTVIAWFHPLLYLYRKAIRLNHEFLADEAVVQTCKNPSNYQLLLIDAISRTAGVSLASRFNYSVTKKRLVMITKTTSMKAALIKQLALLPLIAGIIFLFSSTIIAQEPVKPPVSLPRVESAPEPASQDILEQYNAILNPYNLDTKEGWNSFHKKITREDRDKLEELFIKMSVDQQTKQVVGFMKPAGPLKRTVPSTATFTSFKDAGKYGVWINDKKVPNEKLNNYQASDFAQYNVSKLYGKAKTSVSYLYQVNMMTKSYYQKYYDEVMTNKDKNMMYLVWHKNGVTYIQPRIE